MKSNIPRLCVWKRETHFITEDQDADPQEVGPDLRSSEGSCIGASVTHVLRI